MTWSGGFFPVKYISKIVSRKLRGAVLWRRCEQGRFSEVTAVIPHNIRVYSYPSTAAAVVVARLFEVATLSSPVRKRFVGCQWNKALGQAYSMYYCQRWRYSAGMYLVYASSRCLLPGVPLLLPLPLRSLCQHQCGNGCKHLSGRAAAVLCTVVWVSIALLSWCVRRRLNSSFFYCVSDNIWDTFGVVWTRLHFLYKCRKGLGIST